MKKRFKILVVMSIGLFSAIGVSGFVSIKENGPISVTEKPHQGMMRCPGGKLGLKCSATGAYTCQKDC